MGVNTSSLSNRYITEAALGKEHSSLACSQQEMRIDTAYDHVQLEEIPAVRPIDNQSYANSWHAFCIQMAERRAAIWLSKPTNALKSKGKKLQQTARSLLILKNGSLVQPMCGILYVSCKAEGTCREHF